MPLEHRSFAMPSYRDLMSEYTRRLEDLQVDYGTPVSLEGRLSVAVIMIFEQLADEAEPDDTATEERDEAWGGMKRAAEHVEVMDLALHDVIKAAESAEPYGDDGVTVHLSLSMVQALQDARSGDGKYAKNLARRKDMKARIEAVRTQTDQRP